MTDFLAPMNYNRARDVLSGLSVYQFYNATDAEKAVKLLRNSYPMIFSKLQEKTFGNHAILWKRKAEAETIRWCCFAMLTRLPALLNRMPKAAQFVYR